MCSRSSAQVQVRAAPAGWPCAGRPAPVWWVSTATTSSPCRTGTASTLGHRPSGANPPVPHRFRGRCGRTRSAATTTGMSLGGVDRPDRVGQQNGRRGVRAGPARRRPASRRRGAPTSGSRRRTDRRAAATRRRRRADGRRRCRADRCARRADHRGSTSGATRSAGRRSS